MARLARATTLPAMLDVSLALALVALQIPDIWTTNRILACGGRELNPGVRLLMRMGSRWWWPKVAIAVIAAGILVALNDPVARVTLILLNVVYLAVVASNFRQLARCRPRRHLD